MKGTPSTSLPVFTAYAFSIWKEAYDCGGFVTLDATPTAKRVGVYLNASGLYYADLLELQESGTLGADLVEKINGVIAQVPPVPPPDHPAMILP